MVKMLRILRKEKGLSMKALGDCIGVAESTISQYETGKRQPDLETLSKLSDFFGVTTDYLIGRKEEPPQQNARAEKFKEIFNRLSEEDQDFAISMLQTIEATRGK